MVQLPYLIRRGMGQAEVMQIVDLMDTAMANRENRGILESVSQAVSDLCRKFPVYK